MIRKTVTSYFFLGLPSYDIFLRTKGPVNKTLTQACRLIGSAAQVSKVTNGAFVTAQAKYIRNLKLCNLVNLQQNIMINFTWKV